MADETTTAERPPLRIERAAKAGWATVMAGRDQLGTIVHWHSGGWHFGSFDADRLRELAALMDEMERNSDAAPRR
jgi:hypothetical protein